MVRNRAEWTVTAIHPDGSIDVDGRSGRVRLPSEYVAEHVDLAYARTGAGAQGRTVDIAILYLDGPTDIRNLYVPMTRGRTTNEVFAVTTGEQTALDVVAQSIATDWIDRPALARRAELNSTSTDALAARARINEPDRRQRREHILGQWRGAPAMSEPHRAADPGDPDSTREILRSWKGAPGTESPTTPPSGTDDLRQLLAEQRRAVDRSSPHLDLGL